MPVRAFVVPGVPRIRGCLPRCRATAGSGCARLDRAATYQLRLPEHALGAAAPGKPPPWFAETDPKGPGLELSGRTLGTVGVQAPFLRPESLLLLHLSASGRR
jgi:hypothetical protein